MTVSTLMLGSTLSGTVISIQFTGDEYFHASHMAYLFVWAACASTCAVISLVFSMQLKQSILMRMAKATTEFAVQHIQEKTAHKLYIAETAMFFSIICFCLAMGEFATMRAVGPDICPISSSLLHHSSPRPAASCSLLGASLLQAATRQCNSD